MSNTGSKTPKKKTPNPTGTVKLFILQNYSLPLSSAVLTCITTEKAVLFFQLNLPLKATLSQLAAGSYNAPTFRVHCVGREQRLTLSRRKMSMTK